MFAKLLVLILAVGTCCCGLLAMRQSRLQAAHELAEARLRVREHDERLLQVRARIAELTTPQSVERMLQILGTEEDALTPIIPADLRRLDTRTPEERG